MSAIESGHPIGVGSVWRERRRQYRRRTVEVTAADDAFVYLRTLTTAFGDAPRKPTTSRVRLNLFLRGFTPVETGDA